MKGRLSLDGSSCCAQLCNGFYHEFPYKINENTKTFSNQSLPEDGLNTRNRAGNDSKQQAYTHATVFKPNNHSIK